MSLRCKTPGFCGSCTWSLCRKLHHFGLRFEFAVVQARRGGVRNGFKILAFVIVEGLGVCSVAKCSSNSSDFVGARVIFVQLQDTFDPFFAIFPLWLSSFFPQKIRMGAGLGYTVMIIFAGNALAFWFGMTLRYNEQVNPATGRPWEPGNILAIFFCVPWTIAATWPAMWKDGKHMNMSITSFLGLELPHFKLNRLNHPMPWTKKNCLGLHWQFLYRQFGSKCQSPAERTLCRRPLLSGQGQSTPGGAWVWIKRINPTGWLIYVDLLWLKFKHL